MKKKIITCAGVSFVIIFVLLSVNFLQSGTGSISKENIEKENEFKKSLDVVAQEEEPDEVSKEFANKLGVDEKNIVSTGNTIKSTYYSGIDTSKVNYDTKIIEVSVCLKNTTEEEKEVPITYLSLETTGVGTAISQELLMGNSEHYSSMVEKLEPGEEKVVIYPYEICSIWFHKKDWENVEKRSFWLTFSSYPEKTVLYL
ncbi:hypothetical protein [Mediterraneibacter faecis]|uniref:hypothetical protein n=1 Tax=Mediterraneibacter faecis TaxID=592978 RepID=UPI001D069582|nr:hypothetical protein [Mediterraneibacter faecis]MCB5888950.1 hypothetical protein [Lachnospiraceae bacterium 210521-DFI.4.71]MCB7116787.1 hypothetical protein [Mediterraneibacter faecis]MCB7423428.1 hypothetical protein [Mediterraneibacter faecis]MCG4833292.1 hypothetical protein [Mediterraneibacter faecis]